MSEQSASRTLLKSPPELWAECSDAQSLTRHLDTFFGEIRITRLEPENTVAWEGERGSGTVRLEPAGWGTRVTLTARDETEEEPVDEPVAVEEARAVAEVEEQPPASQVEPASAEVPPGDSGLEQHDGAQVPEQPSSRPTTFLARLFRRFSTEPIERVPEVEAMDEGPPVSVEEEPSVADPPPAPVEEPDPAPVEESSEAADVLAAALDSLGKAHHRPFSRS